MDRLEELGISDNTLIIFSSDNGPTPEGGGDVEFSTRIAFIAAISAICMRVESGCLLWHVGLAEFNRKGSRSDHVSTFWDLMPTLAELAGTEPPKNDGLSFLPALLQEEGQEQHRVFTGNSTIHEGATRKQSGFWMISPRVGKQCDYIAEAPVLRLLSNCMT